MSNRSARAGETIRLRTRIKDDLGDTTTADDLYIHIFEPDEDYNDLTNALVVSGVPTYLGNGIYEYEYTIPPCGPDGTWHDLWVGDLLCQTVSGVLTFSVTTSGVVNQLDSKLYVNDIVQVTVTSGLQATDGSSLDETFESEFMVTASPAYSNIRKVRLEVGAFVNQLPDDVLQLGILEASLEADVLTFATTNTNNELYQHARREYTTCMAASMLLSNVGNLLLRTKTLADLHVEYDTNGVRDAIGRLRDCIEKWQPQLIAGGGAKAATQPKYVVKGEYDPDRPIVSRSWQSTATGDLSNRMPAANDRVRNQGERRHKRAWTKPGKKWW